MNVPTASVVMACLSLLSALFWWQEARKSTESLSLRGTIHRRLTILFGVLAVFLYFSFR